MANNTGAEIVKKFIVTAQLITETPLCIASGMNDGLTDTMVLEDKQGRNYIPATSLAGVLKRAVASAYGKSGDFVEKLLFGSIKENASQDNVNQSMLIISDVLLDKVEKIVRDGVAIDYLTQAGIDKHKYDFEAIERGAVGELSMEITVRKYHLDALSEQKIKKLHNNLEAIEDMVATIADILSSGINLGAMTAKGFGKVKALAANVYAFNFTADKKAWQKYICDDELPACSYKGNALAAVKPSSSFSMSIDLAVKGSLLIADYDAAEEANIAHKKDVSYKKLSAVQMTSKQDFLIPGTSIKGVLRNRALQIMTKLSGNEQSATKFVGDIMGYSRNDENQKNESKQSKLFVGEVYIPRDMVLKQHPQTRNRIDKLTGGTMDTALFTEEPVWQQEKKVKAFTIDLEVKECDPREAGLMLLLLKDLYLGHIAFGGGKAIGRGVVEGCGARISYKNIDFELDSSGRLTGNDSRSNLEIKKKLLEKYVKLLAGEQ